MEHIPTPRETFRDIRNMLKPGGVFAFQTAEYDRVTGRDWWYVGPDNGHISLYSRGALDSLFQQLGGHSRLFWRNYPGVQAWRFDAPEAVGLNVICGTLRSGAAANVEEIGKALRAGTNCGSCLPELRRIVQRSVQGKAHERVAV